MNFEALKNIRNELELTQEDIAKILNVKRGTYASWECASDIIPLNQLYKLAEYYQINIDYLVGLSKKKHKVHCNKELNKKEIASNLFNIRKKLNMAQLPFAKSLNINQSTYWAYEHGKTLITTTTLITLAKTYNYSIDQILNRTKKGSLSVFYD